MPRGCGHVDRRDRAKPPLARQHQANSSSPGDLFTLCSSLYLLLPLPPLRTRPPKSRRKSHNFSFLPFNLRISQSFHSLLPRYLQLLPFPSAFHHLNNPHIPLTLLFSLCPSALAFNFTQLIRVDMPARSLKRGSSSQQNGDRSTPTPQTQLQDGAVVDDATYSSGASSTGSAISGLLVSAVAASSTLGREEVKVNNASVSEMKHSLDDALKRVSCHCLRYLAMVFFAASRAAVSSDTALLIRFGTLPHTM